MSERFYIDCEFDGHGGPLLSIALVHESKSSIHIQTREIARDPWVRENVMPLMDKHHAGHEVIVPLDCVGAELRDWLGNVQNPVFIADSPVDIGRLCAALSTGKDGGWASCDYPLIRFEVHNVDCYPTDLPGAVQHNAWWDAMALRHRLAQVDTHAKRGDPLGAPSPMGSAVGSEAGDAPGPSTHHPRESLT